MCSQTSLQKGSRIDSTSQSSSPMVTIYASPRWTGQDPSEALMTSRRTSSDAHRSHQILQGKHVPHVEVDIQGPGCILPVAIQEGGDTTSPGDCA